jgi:hypothetical protein
VSPVRCWWARNQRPNRGSTEWNWLQRVVILDETPSSTQAPRDQEHAIELNPAEPAVDQSRGDLIQDNS